MRFLVQAANGVGAVGLDTGGGRRLPRRPGRCRHRPAEPGHRGADVGLAVRSDGHRDATRADRSRTAPSRFTVSRDGTQLFQYADASAADGTVVLKLPAGESPPSGRLTVRADLIGASGNSVDSQTTEVVIGGATFALSPGSLTTRAGTAYPAATPLTATLTDARGPMPGVPVTFTLPTGSPGGHLPGQPDHGAPSPPMRTASRWLRS